MDTVVFDLHRSLLFEVASFFTNEKIISNAPNIANTVRIVPDAKEIKRNPRVSAVIPHPWRFPAVQRINPFIPHSARPG